MIIISADNRQEYGILVDGKYEYEAIQLDKYQSQYIGIPLSVIVDTSLDTRRVGAFSYLRLHYGLNNVVNFTIPDIVTWCGGKPNRRPNESNDKILSIIDCFADRGYLTYLTEKSRSSYMKCYFDTDYYYDETANGYAAIYLDELDKIMCYQKENIKNSKLSNTTILLVFAYLRHKIVRRKNLLKPEERSSDGIKERRERNPEAYYSNIQDIANDLGISSKTTAQIIDILELELGLIVTDRAYRVKNEDDEFRTLPTIFANTYKREENLLLCTGDDYSRTEIELKAEKMKKHYQGYRINKTKRKI